MAPPRARSEHRDRPGTQCHARAPRDGKYTPNSGIGAEIQPGEPKTQIHLKKPKYR